MARTAQVRKSARATEKVLRAALSLFSRQGFRATSMRQIAARARLSVGNVYHHFGGKEAIFERLLEQYWDRLRDPELTLNKIFYSGDFPDDLEAMADAIEEIVDENGPHILLIYIDVIEFRGKHIREFYRGMADRFSEAYGEPLERKRRKGEFGDIDPMVGVMVAARWFFYFYTIEKCFGAPMHFGMTPEEAVREFIRILRLGLLPRPESITDKTVTRASARARGVRPGR